MLPVTFTGFEKHPFVSYEEKSLVNTVTVACAINHFIFIVIMYGKLAGTVIS